MPVMLTQVNLQRATLMDYVKWTAVAPAKAWGLYGTKGVIAAGAHADIVFVDMGKTGTLSQGRLQTLSKISPWHGRAVQGYPMHTLLRGRFVMQHGKLVEEAITHGRSVKGIQAMARPQPRNQQHYSSAIVNPPPGVRPNALPAEDVPR